MHRSFIAIAAAALLAGSTSTALAQDGGQKGQPGIDWDQSQVILEEGAKRVIDALGLFMQAIPTYELPEVLPNGDIIIRRKKPAENDQRKQTPEHDRT